MDRSNAATGLRTEPVRRTEAEGVVDTGAVMLVLPQNVVEGLGLEPLRTAILTYADERKEERPVAGPVAIEVCDRMMVTECVVGPPLSEPSIGQMVLEALDLIADRANRGPHAADTGLPVAQAQEHLHAGVLHLSGGPAARLGLA